MPGLQNVVAPRTSLVRKIGRAPLVLTVVLIGSACAGAIYQVIGMWNDAHRFPQKGRSVRVGNFGMNLNCSGQGTPTVVLDSGGGVPAIGWIKVQPDVAKFARVCSYDRAGYGWSDPGPEPRTSQQIAKELKALLDNAGEHAPYIVVGHSFGGYDARVLTHLYPADVAGVVLVDPTHEDEYARASALWPEAVRQQEKKNDEWNAKLDRIMTPIRIYLGVERLEVAMGWSDPGAPSKELRQEFLYLEQQSKSQAAFAAEDKAETETIVQVRAAGNLGDRPLIVLTAGRPYDPDPLLTKEQMEKQNDLWIHDLQAQEARLSTRGKQIIVSDSSHMIPYERPDAVISAIHEVWSALQNAN
jgi:pimeloyl-ACP methyl ester carboxylesterase